MVEVALGVLVYAMAIISLKVKVNVTLENAMRAQR